MGYRYSAGTMFRLMKQAMKDHERGALDREQTVARIEVLCGRLLEWREEPEQMSLFDLQTRVKQHLGRNRR